MKYQLLQSKKDILAIESLRDNLDKKETHTPSNLAFETVTKPWGYEYLLYQDEDFAIWLLYLAPNSGTSLHCHILKQTTMIVIEGVVKVEGLNSEFYLEDLDHIEIEKSTFHRSYSTEGAYLLEVERPNQKLDLLRLQDNYGRDRLKYEGEEHYKKIKKNYDYIDSEKLIKSKMQFTKLLSSKEIYIGPIENYKPVNADQFDTKIVILSEKNLGFEQLKGNILEKLKESDYDNILNILSVSSKRNIQTGANLIAQILDQVEAEIFSSVGDINLHLIESLARIEGVNLNLFPNDDIAFKAMSAYAKLTKNKCVYIPSSSPETLNIIPQIISNWVDSNPLTCLIVDADFNKKVINSKLRQGYNKGFPLLDLLKVFSSSILRISYFNKSNYKKIFNLLIYENDKRSDTKFILLSPEVCTQTYKVEESWNFDKNMTSFKFKLLRKKLRKVIIFYKIKYFIYLLIKNISKSEKFMVIIGDGVKHNKYLNFFIKTLESLNTPIFTTRSAIEIIDNLSASYYGRIGGYGSRVSNHIINSSDLILIIGSRLSTSLVTRAFENFAPKTKKFIVDIDKQELNKKYLKNAKKLEADSENFLLYFNDVITNLQSRSKLLKTNKTYREIYNKYNPHNEYKNYSTTNLYRFINDVTETFDSSDCVIVDGGPLLHYINQAAIVRKGQTWINLSSMEESGYSLAAAIGAFVYQENNNKNKSRIRVFCEAHSIFKSLDSLHYINSHNLPIDIFVISHGNNTFINAAQNIIYPYSFVGREIDNVHYILKQVLAGMNNFYIIEWNDVKNKKFELNKKNNVVVFTLDLNQEMNPRPSFMSEESGKWHTKPLTNMDPESIIDEKIKKDLEMI